MDLPHLSGLTPPNLPATSQVSAPAPQSAALSEPFESLVAAPSGAEMEALFWALSAPEAGEGVAPAAPVVSAVAQGTAVGAPSMAESLFSAFHGAPESAPEPGSEIGSDAVGALRLQALLGEMR